MSYPEKSITIKALLNAAESAANNSTVEHPEDIAFLMSAAVEGAAPALVAMHSLLRNGNGEDDE